MKKNDEIEMQFKKNCKKEKKTNCLKNYHLSHIKQIYL